VPERRAASADRTRGLVCLHFASRYNWNAPQPQPVSSPMLLAVRQGKGAFPDTFTFTPTGSTTATAAKPEN